MTKLKPQQEILTDSFGVRFRIMCPLYDAFNKVAATHTLQNEVASIGLVEHVVQLNNVWVVLDYPECRDLVLQGNGFTRVQVPPVHALDRKVLL